MVDIFLKIVNMSISASWIVLAVVLLRILFKKAPKWITVLLWGIVAVRLICPFSIESVMSLMPSAETISPEIMMDRTPQINTGVPIINSTLNPIISSSFSPEPMASANPLQILIPFLSAVWIMGIVLLLVYTAVSYWRVCRKVRTAVLLRDNIYQSETVVSPFVLGIIKPKIYLPFNASVQDMEHVIAHEMAHICRKDHLWKPFGFLLLTIHWFNPLMWLGYLLLCRDIELACDEKVVKKLNIEQRADYSQALLTCSVNRRMIAACPLAFGEVGVKDRVKSVLNYKKPAFWFVAIAIILSVAVSVCFLTNPKTKEWESDNYTIMCNVISAECDNIVYEYMNGTFGADYPYICVNWTNNTNDVLCFGEEFVIYKNDKVYEPYQEIGFDAILHTVNPQKSKSENYVLFSYKLEKGETYKLEKTFYLESNPEKKYTAYISFTVDSIYSFAGKQYKGEKVVYADGSHSYVMSDNNIPQFKISEQAFDLYRIEETLNYDWKKIDGLQKIKLEKANFDNLFTDNEWIDGYSPSKIRKNNLNAFSAFDLNGVMYYLLEQKNGEIYIAQSDASISNFRWLFKMREIDKTVSAELTNTDTFKEPPTLTVISNENSVDALQGTTSWLYRKKNGKAVGIESDSMHPLQSKKYMSSLDLLPTVLSHVDPLGAILQFNAKGITPIYEMPPDEVYVSCWNEKEWGNVYAQSEKITVNLNNNNLFFTLKDGNYIYEVVATWNSSEKYSGTVRYSFYTVKPDMNQVTVTHYPNHLALYEQTPVEQIEEKYDNEEFVISKTHYQLQDKRWNADGYTYKYRLEITGRMNNAAKNTTYIVLSNTKDITFEQAWKASGFSSLATDYFNPENAVIVGNKLFS